MYVSEIIFLIGDGIFDKLSNKDVIAATWEAIDRTPDDKSIHAISGDCVEAVMKGSVDRKTLDNITVVFVLFGNIKANTSGHLTESKENCVKGPKIQILNGDLTEKDVESGVKVIQLNTNKKKPGNESPFGNTPDMGYNLAQTDF
jgi:hypothetical protein